MCVYIFVHTQHTQVCFKLSKAVVTSHTDAHMNEHAHTHTHARLHAYTHIRARAHTHTHTHTHTYTPTPSLPLLPPPLDSLYAHPLPTLCQRSASVLGTSSRPCEVTKRKIALNPADASFPSTFVAYRTLHNTFEEKHTPQPWCSGLCFLFSLNLDHAIRDE